MQPTTQPTTSDTTRRMQRHRYEFVLEAAQPIAHLAENIGNEGVLMRRKVRTADGSFASVPMVTADTMRHGMREAAAYMFLDAAGWSAGKDSTCLAHLVTVEMGLRHVELVSQKDDLDFPGEEEFVREHAAAWGAKLTIVRPDISALGYVREHMCEFDEDLHSRQAGLSKAVFYNVVEKANSQFDLVMMGMRAEESRARKLRMHTHGAVMRLKSGRVRANPLALWTGLDVLTYTHTRKVPMLQLYRCIAYMHDRKPWDIRKSWWIYGKNPNNIAWLRHYYPSLHRTWSSFMPNVSVIG